MKKAISALLLLVLFFNWAHAHHGVVSLGTAGLEGPGAPIETSSSAILPQDNILGYFKSDYAKFNKFTKERDDESDCSIFFIYGLGYAPTSFLSLYFFVPFNTKVTENNSYNTGGFADVSLMGVLGFKYDEGFKLVPKKESLDEMADWHFTTYLGTSLPTGNPNVQDSEGNIDPGMSLGFGFPCFSLGFTATKQLLEKMTFVFDTSYIGFLEYEYNDGNKLQFGDEFKVNTALNYKIFTSESLNFRMDANIEANYLKLGRDIENGIGAEATGGHIVYWLPGLRLYYKSTSLGLGIKFPAWAKLNESEEQQGSEGKEKYRFIFSFSFML